MSYVPSVDQARELVRQYNKESFHLQHAETVSKVMGEIAQIQKEKAKMQKQIEDTLKLLGIGGFGDE